MADKLILHIGVMKSGTSFVQRTLAANPAPLAEQGVLFPGRGWGDQVAGVRDILDQHREGSDPSRSRGAWQRLTDEMADWPGTAVISMEFLGPARRNGVRRVAESLGSTELHVVMTVRDLGRTVPAMWQEGLKNYQTWTWEEYLDGVRAEDRSKPGPARTFWHQQDVPEMVRRWSTVVPAERLTLVTLPPAGSDPQVLWRRFCSLVEIEPDSCAPGPRRNESLGAASALVLRELNVLLAERGVTRAEYGPLVKRGLARRHLSQRTDREPPIGFDERWVRVRAGRMIEELRELPVTVLGDLDELLPAAVPGVKPTRVTDRQQTEAAVEGLASLLAASSGQRPGRQRPGGQRPGGQKPDPA